MNVNDNLKMRVMQILSLTTLNEVTRITDRRNINIGKFTARGILESGQVLQVLVPGSTHNSTYSTRRDEIMMDAGVFGKTSGWRGPPSR